LVQYSKIESGKFVLDPSPVYLPSLAKEAIQIVSGLAKHKGLQLDMVIEPYTPKKILIDRQQFRQVLVNLLGNAVKFTNKGKVQLHVGIAKGILYFYCRWWSMRAYGFLIDPSERKKLLFEEEILIFTVTDEGIGISPEGVRRLFTDYEKVGDLRDANAHGTGLGLSIAKFIVEHMGGTIRAKSDGPGLGAEFQVTIRVQMARFHQDEGLGPSTPVPVRQAQNLSPNSESDKLKHRARSYAALKLAGDGKVPKRALIIDDDKTCCTALTYVPFVDTSFPWCQTWCSHFIMFFCLLVVFTSFCLKKSNH
jgi:hypothetical protein